MKNAFRKDFIREIKKNKGRFLSIFFIVMLGTAFFSGVRSAGGDMKHTADEFFKRSQMMDIRVVGTYGITDDDLEDMRKIDGVESATGGYTREVIVSEKEEQYVLKLIAATKDVNEVILISGRLPEKPNECVADASLTGYRIGDVLKTESGTDDPLEDDLNETEFTITGFGNLPYYLDFTRGVGSIGNGTVKAFAVVPAEAFCMDQYTESYIRVKGTEQFNSYSDEYEELVDEVSDQIEGIENKINIRRYKHIVTDAQMKIDDAKEELNDAQKELDDAKKELDDAKKELDDGKKELDDAEKELDDAKKELDDGEKELEDGKKELDDAKAELESAEKELADAKAELDSAEQQLAQSRTELESAKKELDENEKKLKDGKKELEDAKKQLESGEKQLNEAKKTLDSGKKELDAKGAELEAAHGEMDKNAAELQAAWKEYEAGKAEIDEQAEALDTAKAGNELMKEELEKIRSALIEDPEDPELSERAAVLEATIAQTEEQIAAGEALIDAGRTKLDAAYAELSANQAAFDKGAAELAQADLLYEQGKKQYESGLAEYEKNYKAYTDAREAYEKGTEEIKNGSRQYEEGVKQYEAGLEQYKTGLAKYDDGKKQYESGLAEYEAGKKKYEDGLAEYEDSLAQFEDGKKEYEDGLKKYEDGKKEYEDGLKEYEDGLKEYEEACAEHLPEIEDGWKEVADAQEDLRRLDKPQLYALDRDMIQSVASLNQDAKRMDSLGNVFPVVFFLVAALVSLTAMTRMVDEQRQGIGTLKALGFSSGAIIWKYMEYALIPSVLGGVIGVFIGEYVIPKVIIDSYRIMYTSLDRTLLPFNWQQGVTAVVAATGCTCLAAWAACYRKLKDKPAALIRPEAPAGGRRVFLEYITPVWKHLKFTAKSTVRNLFRYKKRLFMTIIGIGACMGLIIVGFGLYDSIKDVAKRQYKEIFRQDAMVGIDSGAAVKQIRDLKETIESREDITASCELAQIPGTLYNSNTKRSAYLYIPEETENITEFLRFRNRVTLEPFDYPKEGVGLAEKTAAMLDVKVGDTVLVQKGDSGEKKEATVTVIVENYVQHYCFMTKETYNELFGEPPEYSDFLICYEDTSAENEKRLGEFFLEQDACSSISFTTDFQKQIDDMLSVLTKVIWVLLISAGLLAFVVLYNLNSINITERKRELATLKVLGFKDIEVAFYVYRENIVLTAMGIVLGCFIGLILHRYTILTVEVDLMMFGRSVRLASFIKSALITFLFAVMVNLAMFFSLKKINMIESLKSVE